MAADTVCGSIDTLTKKAQACQGPANEITLDNADLAIVGEGPIPVLATGLREIVDTNLVLMAVLSESKPFTVKSEEDAILKSFVTFAQTLRALLNTLIDKAAMLPPDVRQFGQRLIEPLMNLGFQFPELGTQLMDMVPDNKKDMQDQLNSVTQPLSVAIDRWRGNTNAKL